MKERGTVRLAFTPRTPGAPPGSVPGPAVPPASAGPAGPAVRAATADGPGDGTVTFHDWAVRGGRPAPVRTAPGPTARPRWADRSWTAAHAVHGLPGADAPAGRPQLPPDPGPVRAVVGDRLQRARREVFLCCPGGDPTAAALADLVLAELPRTDRTLRVRIVHQHPARFHLPTQRQARAAERSGAEVRTTGESCGPLLVVDRESAFLPERGRPDGLVLVEQPSVVAHLADSFETLWHQGEAFRSGPAAARAVSDELRATILRLLADGLKDEVIARRLGLSLRNCRRHIAGLYSSLGADSRFQAGVLAERHGLTGNASAAGPAARRERVHLLP
ncbi:LuxR C-terminal-related transcriptional regulator [Kitasatospora sp. NPDC018619]|uniref:helix-turn-helix transcriptional regulator n=1 Tax=unclassified Kitasatospora TaxID=2633591 RepID=UPI00378FCFFA